MYTRIPKKIENHFNYIQVVYKFTRERLEEKKGKRSYLMITHKMFQA